MEEHAIAFPPSVSNPYTARDERRRYFPISCSIGELSFMKYIMLHYFCFAVFKLVFEMHFNEAF